MLFLTMVKIKTRTILSHEFLEKVENFAIRDDSLIKPEEIIHSVMNPNTCRM